MQLVDPEVVTVRDLAVAMNSFYVDFLERCIRENREFARLQESECYRENCKQNDKVECCLFFSQVYFYVFTIMLVGYHKWLSGCLVFCCPV